MLDPRLNASPYAEPAILDATFLDLDWADERNTEGLSGDDFNAPRPVRTSTRANGMPRRKVSKVSKADKPRLLADAETVSYNNVNHAESPNKVPFSAQLNQWVLDYLSLDASNALLKREKERLRDKMVHQLLPYVKKIASSLARRSSDPVEDLIQVGTIGLLKALEKYNPLAGTSFKTYATYFITGEMRHYLRDKASMIKAPREMQELYYRINVLVQHLSDTLGRAPTDAELAEELQCSTYKINAAQDADRRRHLISLDQFNVHESGDESVYIERLVDERNLEAVSLNENRMAIDDALSKLPEELRTVVRLTYFEDLSQSVIAERLGVSQMQISRRLRKALELMSKELTPANR